VGVPLDQGLSAKNIYEAFHALIALFSDQSVRSLYPNCLWDHGGFEVRGGVINLPPEITTWPEVEGTRQPPAVPNKYYFSGVEKTLDPARIAKDFTGRVLAEAGLMHYEENLDRLAEKYTGK
jgi:hypothetical protein